MLSRCLKATSGSYFRFSVKAEVLAERYDDERRAGRERCRRWDTLMRLTAALLLALTLSHPLLSTAAEDARKPVVWKDPGDIHARNLFYGLGGKEDVPTGPFEYVREDKGGTSPKFEVKDASGEKWKGKLRLESQAEVVASRLLWAIGYFTNENYFVPNLEVKELPVHLHRGQGHVISPGHLDGARLQRHRGNEKKEANWNWQHNPFVDTREFNALRVMMVLLSNWDLKDENNAIFTDKEGQEQYLVTDVGTAFGASG
jgi:hypothetical protein